MDENETGKKNDGKARWQAHLFLPKKTGFLEFLQPKQRQAARRLIAEELELDGAGGKERKLPSSFRLVIFQCPTCQAAAVATANGPADITRQRAAELAQGAEVLDLSEKRAEREPEEPPSGGSNGPEACPARDVLKSQVVSAPQSLIQHAENLSTPDRPVVPPEERDRPNTPEDNRAVLSREGFWCIIPGCNRIATRNHHLEWRSHGGKICLENGSGLCEEHHRLVHEGKLLLSEVGGKLVVSDQNLKPLEGPASAAPPAVELEVEPSLPEPEAGPEPAISSSAAGAPLFEDRFETIPGTIDPPWWRRHRGAFEWSERRKLWIFHPERLADRASAAEDPPASGPAGVGSAARNLQSFIGQKKVVSSLSIAIQAARLCGEAPPPILLSGPPGLVPTFLFPYKVIADLLPPCGVARPQRYSVPYRFRP
ncbi:MAG: hypothetical protein HY717_03135, partial [Planctomycetes bacterium]|nr:hypothetical protein [Planctomycetota bacterium]